MKGQCAMSFDGVPRTFLCAATVAAEVLAAAGWDVILDGDPVAPAGRSDHNGSAGDVAGGPGEA